MPSCYDTPAREQPTLTQRLLCKVFGHRPKLYNPLDTDPTFDKLKCKTCWYISDEVR